MITYSCSIRTSVSYWKSVMNRFNPLYVLKNGIVVDKRTLENLVSSTYYSYADLIEGWDD